jgi:hypothetical protein
VEADLSIIDQYLAWAHSQRPKSTKTLGSYRRELLALARHASSRGRGPLAALTEEDLAAYVYDRRNDKPGSWSARRACIPGFYGWLVATGRRSDDPGGVIPRPVLIKRRPGPRTGRLGRKLSRLEPLDQQIVAFLLEVGDLLRVEEAFSIEEEPPVSKMVRVRTGGGAERDVTLPESARRLLEGMGGKLPRSVRTFQKRLQAVGLSPSMLKRGSRSAVKVELQPDVEDAVHAYVGEGEWDTAVRLAFGLLERSIQDLLSEKGVDTYGRRAVDQALGEGGALLAGIPEPKDREPIWMLFSGGFGYFRNLLSHGNRRLEDPMLAREALLMADALMRLLDTIEQNLARQDEDGSRHSG